MPSPHQSHCAEMEEVAKPCLVIQNKAHHQVEDEQLVEELWFV